MTRMVRLLLAVALTATMACETTDGARDAGPADGADVAPADTEGACPAAPPFGVDQACAGSGLRCEFGQECCCGECHVSVVCTCDGGTWGCYFTDACMVPACPDAGPTDAGPTDAGPTDAGPTDARPTDAARDAAAVDVPGGDAAGACPAEPPFGVDQPCADPGQRCVFGRECCCGECFDALVCSCMGGTWGCYNTDACLIPGCPDVGAPDAGAADGADTAGPAGCRSDPDCDAGAACAPPGTPRACGMCRHFEPECATDGDCAEGVCELTSAECACEPARRCVSACTADADCAAGLTCSPQGHCAPIACATDGDCPPHFRCPEAGRRGDAVCVRRGCAADADCADGFCVLGLCHAALGTCELPVP